MGRAGDGDGIERQRAPALILQARPVPSLPGGEGGLRFAKGKKGRFNSKPHTTLLKSVLNSGERVSSGGGAPACHDALLPRSQGVADYDPRVVLRLLDFLYRYRGGDPAGRGRARGGSRPRTVRVLDRVDGGRDDTGQDVSRCARLGVGASGVRAITSEGGPV